LSEVSNATYHWLKQRITTMPKDESTFLTEAAVAEESGASRTPVREAIMRLEAEGLVERIPKRGAFVPPLSDAEIRSVMRAREMIELWAVDEFLVHPRPEATEQLVTTIAAQEAAIADPERFIELDSDLHGLIVGVGANKVVEHFYAELRDRQIRMGLHAVKASTGRSGHVLGEHRAIVDALRAGDRDAARTATSAHLARTLEVMLS
jgi:DNA-binding GntR family transcriptional regulator